ncbi:hypothetical protein EXIGLDRAFT_747599 [Exidia glandulosa HHB12029]|uniref:F-box domain-containing protein n=1 Tax=Exidia glandulosa HHB12029 TaxID=1314781 RepID=A0A165KN01_EXIGL|nr:hypothetical protein EXIGLDRAFT_747599 [Exidia glandulosa HHB12029]
MPPDPQALARDERKTGHTDQFAQSEESASADSFTSSRQDINNNTRVLSEARLVSKVLDAIRDNLGRIKSLDLDFDSFPTSSHHSVTRALSNPAPSLQHLALHSSSPMVVLPRRLFGGELLQLQKLALVGFALPNSLSGCPATDDAFFRHLQGDLSMALPLSGWNKDAGTVRIEVTEIGPSKRLRCVTRESIETLVDERLDYGAVLCNITAATIPFGLIQIMQHWFEENMLFLRRMRVIIVDGVGHHDPFLFLNCPKLERLEVSNGSPGLTQISHNDFEYLAFGVLNVRARFATLEVVLENVTIDGSDHFSDDEDGWDSSECECCGGDGCYCCAED